MTFCLLLIALTSVAWDYKQNGADWAECTDAAHSKYQSPIDVVTRKAKLLNNFYFFPRFLQTLEYTCDMQNQTLNLRGDFGYLYTITPYSIVMGMRMTGDHIEFHSPSEHTFNGKHLDLEMQIFFNNKSYNGDPKMKKIAVSFFFDSTTNVDSVFLKQFVKNENPEGKKYTVDLNMLFSPDMVEKYQYYGYRGINL
jgi:carbonic anhydrase